MKPISSGFFKRRTGYSQIDDAIHVEQRQFRGEFDHQTIFKGKPNPGLDVAWDSISIGHVISINDDVFPLINKTADTAAKLPAAQGGGYMASLDVFHQLHCL
ncbi:MAG: hypothetical protein Q9198_000282, partial [Flavoplaca austrocitrina]